MSLIMLHMRSIQWLVTCPHATLRTLLSTRAVGQNNNNKKKITTDSAQAIWGEINYLTVEIMLFHTLTKMNNFGVTSAILFEGANSGQI